MQCHPTSLTLHLESFKKSGNLFECLPSYKKIIIIVGRFRSDVTVCISVHLGFFRRVSVDCVVVQMFLYY